MATPRMSFVSSLPLSHQSLGSTTVVLRSRSPAAASAARRASARMDFGAAPAAPRRSSTAPNVGQVGGTGGAESAGGSLWRWYVRTSTVLTNLFPLWTVLCAVLGLWRPALFTWLPTRYFGWTLGLLMLSMGITLSLRDFRRVLRRMGAVSIGFVGCYVLMPALAWLLAQLFGLPGALAAGTVLVGAINGGQASNLCTYIANGNVALSVMMTTSTTLGAIVMTPLLAKLMTGTSIAVDALGISLSTIQVVLLPITLGMLLNRYCHRVVQAVLPFSPVVGVLATCVLVGSAVAQSAAPILAAGLSLQLPILLLHLLGGALGYLSVAAAGYGEVVRRTVAIETSMKSSAFGYLLATRHFGAYMVRVPSAISVVWMSLVGSTLAVIWRYVPVREQPRRFDRSISPRYRAKLHRRQQPQQQQQPQQ